MKNFIFTVVALKHHDYKDRLEELYDTAKGMTMSISIEKDNPFERNAIPVYHHNEFVGYVSSGEERRLAYQAIKQSGKTSLSGVVTDVNREDKVLELTVKTRMEIDTERNDEESQFNGWSFDDMVLPLGERVCRLRVMIDILCDAAMTDESWSDEYEKVLCFIEDNLWRDLCYETEVDLGKLCHELKRSSVEEWNMAGKRISKTIGRLSNEENVAKRVKEINDQAYCKQMDILLNYYGKRQVSTLNAIPKWFDALFEKDQADAVRRLRYERLNERQTQAIKTLLAMKVRISKETPSDSEEDSAFIDYVMQLEPCWNCKGDAKIFWKELRGSKFKKIYKDKEMDLFENPTNDSDVDKVTIQQVVGIMHKENMYFGTSSELGVRMEPKEQRNGTCARNIRKSTLSLPKFGKCAENLRKFLNKWD